MRATIFGSNFGNVAVRVRPTSRPGVELVELACGSSQMGMGDDAIPYQELTERQRRGLVEELGGTSRLWWGWFASVWGQIGWAHMACSAHLWTRQAECALDQMVIDRDGDQWER